MLVVLLKSCFASKCEDVSFCWGLINVHREVELERPELNVQPTQMQNFSEMVRPHDESKSERLSHEKV